MNTGDYSTQPEQSACGPSGMRMVGQSVYADGADDDASHAQPCLEGRCVMMTDTSDSTPATALAWRRKLVVPSRAQAGMRLMEDVSLRNGAKLLPAGTVLDAQTLQRLVQRQVDVIVVSVPDERTPEQLEADIEAVRMRLDHIFRGPSSSVRDLLKRGVMAHSLASVMPCTPAI